MLLGRSDSMAAGARSNREKRLAVATAVLVVGAVMFGAIIGPQLEERRVRMARLNSLELKLMKMKADLLVKDRIESVYSRIEPLIACEGTDQQEISLLARNIGALYSNLNVKIRSVKILPVVSDEFYRRLSLKVEMTGDIRDVLSFIYSVETSGSALRIEKVDLKARDITDNVQVTFLITKIVSGREDPEASNG